MKIVQVGLDSTTLAFLRSNGIHIEDTGKLDDVEELEEWLLAGECDAVVLNIDTGKFGIYAARHLRKKKMHHPVIGISEGSADRPWPEERAIFLENGGDDLLHSPANPRELVATLHATIRRFNGAVQNVLEFTHGKAVLKVNLSTRTVYVNGREPDITGSEKNLLLHFASHPNRLITREAVMNILYSDRADDPPEIKIVDVFMYHIRKKLALIEADAYNLFETVWGEGYKLVSESVKKVA